jgi:hypothetical protein
MARLIRPSASGISSHLRTGAAEIVDGLAPQSVADHDAARTIGIAEGAQRLGKALAGLVDRGLVHSPVAQHEAVVLVGLQDLFAPPLAAHHEETAPCHQFGRRHELPCPLEQRAAERLNQRCDGSGRAAGPVQPRHQHGNLQCRQLQRRHVGRPRDLLPQRAGLFRQQAEHFERLDRSGVECIGHRPSQSIGLAPRGVFWSPPWSNRGKQDG